MGNTLDAAGATSASSSSSSASATAASLTAARASAILDDEERAALMFLTSRDAVTRTAPSSSPAEDITAVRARAVATLTSVGCRTGAVLSARPAELHLVTRNFCSRLVRNAGGGGSLLFRDLLHAAVAQLRVVSGETPSQFSAPGSLQREMYMRRACNTLVLCRILLMHLLAHRDEAPDPQGTLLRRAMADVVGADDASGGGSNAREDRDSVRVLLVGLVNFCSPPPGQEEEKEASAAAATTRSAAAYDIRAEALNLLLVLLSTRLFRHQHGADPSHLFLGRLRAMAVDPSGRGTLLVSRLVTSLLQQFIARAAAPSGSALRAAAREMSAFPPRYATLTSPPVPEELYALALDDGGSVGGRISSGGASVASNIAAGGVHTGSGIANGVLSAVTSSLHTLSELSPFQLLYSYIMQAAYGAEGAGGILGGTTSGYSFCPLADRSMLLLCVLVHDFDDMSDEEEGKEERAHGMTTEQRATVAWNAKVFRRSLSELQDEEDIDASGGGGRGGGRDMHAAEAGRSRAPRVSFSALYDALAKSLEESFVEPLYAPPSLGGVAGAAMTAEAASTAAAHHDAFAVLRLRVVGARSAILLYTLMTAVPAFREFVLARDDLDRLVLPLLRALHGHHGSAIDVSSSGAATAYTTCRPLPAAHLYVCIILLLVFSQDESFSEGSFTRCDRLPVRALQGWFSAKGLVAGGLAVSTTGTDGARTMFSLGSVALTVLRRAMQAEATRHRWQDRRGDEGDSDESSYLCDNLCAAFSNLSLHARSVHPYTAQRLVSLVSVLSRRMRWAARRAKDIARHDLTGPPAPQTLQEQLPMLGAIVTRWAGTARPERVWNNDGVAGGANDPLLDTEQTRLALSELDHLESQVSVCTRFLRVAVDCQCKCLRPQVVRHNLHLLYALLHDNMASSSSSASKGSLFSPFKERAFASEFEQQPWAIELCTVADPLIDLVEFMQHVLEDRAASGGGRAAGMSSPQAGFAGWSSVDDVMQVLSEGAREYRTRRERISAAEHKGRGQSLIPNGMQDGAEASASAAAAASFVYEEADGASAFFLPYSWSLSMDLTRDLMWPCDAVGLFPVRPFFREEAEAMRRQHAQDEAEAATRGQQVQQHRQQLHSEQQFQGGDLMSPL